MWLPVKMSWDIPALVTSAPVPHFPHLQNGGNSPNLIELLQGVNELKIHKLRAQNVAWHICLPYLLMCYITARVSQPSI